ncbi:MAG TPA: adenosylcobalamin-dependent ribonucleoside-diphosphate reductase, partial [Steroidobacteraceae bacterium]|nr:adenosylcobalamin-dependent ribonucleoside-diphosphate reductase [Steroidobacteraceae bacterium]
AGAGTSRRATLFNCFVMGPIEDSMRGIFDALREGAITLQQGGGVGYDFSTLRPTGALARESGSIASGPVSFMKVWDAACATIQSTGRRRGAMMATLRCDHPDIETFIDAKRAGGDLTHFNLSVLISDAFMDAVKHDREWPLVFPEAAADRTPASGCHMRVWNGSPKPVRCRTWKVVRARTLWRRLCDSAHECGEPGVLFIDRINADNNLGYCETVSATNPCAEEPLPPYGACNLGSLNLAAFVRKPFSATAKLDEPALLATARVAVRFLDDIINVSSFPLLKQSHQALRTRRIGLGITGLGDALAMLGLRYDTQAARTLASDLMRNIRDAAYEASIELAKEKGPFPAFRNRYLQQPFIARLPAEIRGGIERHGIRNSHLLAIAPAGSISLLAGNISSGIEPLFGIQAVRRMLDASGELHTVQVTDHAYALWRAQQKTWSAVPEYFVNSYHVSPRDHLLMQAALQPYIDGAISKTVALPAKFPKEELPQILEAAYDLNLKGCTVFREGARPGVVTPGYLTEPQGAAEALVRCCDFERETD